MGNYTTLTESSEVTYNNYDLLLVLSSSAPTQPSLFSTYVEAFARVIRFDVKQFRIGDIVLGRLFLRLGL
jgi:hypothetical protein